MIKKRARQTDLGQLANKEASVHFIERSRNIRAIQPDLPALANQKHPFDNIDRHKVPGFRHSTENPLRIPINALLLETG